MSNKTKYGIMHTSGAIAGMRLSHKIFDMSLDLFVTLFLWNSTRHDLGLLCLYRCIFSISVFTAMIVFVYISRTRMRKLIMIFGRILLVVYCMTLAAMGNKCIQFIMPLAVLHGFGVGSYYVIYNQFEAEGISSNMERRGRFLGRYEAVSAIVKTLYPIIMGVMMQKWGIVPVAVVSGMSSIMIIIFALLYKDGGCNEKVSFKAYFNDIKTNDITKKGALYFAECDFWRSITHSYASFELFTGILLMTFTGGAATFGIANSAMFLFSILFGLLFGRITKSGGEIVFKGQKMLLAICFILGINIFIQKDSGIFLGLFLFAWQSYLSTVSLVYSTAHGAFAKRYVKNRITECYVLNEAVLTIGRLVGYGGLYLLSSKIDFGNINGFIIYPVITFVLYMTAAYLAYKSDRKLWRLMRDN